MWQIEFCLPSSVTVETRVVDPAWDCGTLPGETIVAVVVWACGIFGVGDDNAFALLVTLLIIHLFSCGSCLICWTVCGVNVIVCCDTIGWAWDVGWCCCEG